MSSYAAFFGHTPHISHAELAAILFDIRHARWLGDSVLAFDTDLAIDQSFLNGLGGTMLIARRISSDAIGTADIPALLATELEGHKGKATFSLRAEGVPRSAVRDLYRACKERLKRHGIPSRYIGSEKKPALSVQLHDGKLLSGEGGCEIVLMRHRAETWIGKTVAAQDTKGYTTRDMEKPVRDMGVGILPPKLAQILLNFGGLLAGKHTSLTVLDPFCGSGVIPMECLLRGWHVLASDSSPKAVKGCEKNIEWTRKTFGIKKQDVTGEIVKHDARKAFPFEAKPDVVVSETSLGTNFKSRPSVGDAESSMKEIEHLMEEFLKNAAKSLPGVPLVLTLPVWYSKKRPMFLTTALKTAAKLGYRLTLPPGISGTAPDRPTLLYRRKDQFVGREIALFAPAA